MKFGLSCWFGLALVLCSLLMGCGKVIAPVDTYGFKQAFDEHTESENGSKPIGEVSIKLAEDILDAVQSEDLTAAQLKLETLRKQTDLSPRQRLETKALHTAVEQYLAQPGDKSSEQNAATSNTSSSGKTS